MWAPIAGRIGTNLVLEKTEGKKGCLPERPSFLYKLYQIKATSKYDFSVKSYCCKITKAAFAAWLRRHEYLQQSNIRHGSFLL